MKVQKIEKKHAKIVEDDSPKKKLERLDSFERGVELGVKKPKKAVKH